MAALVAIDGGIERSLSLLLMYLTVGIPMLCQGLQWCKLELDTFHTIIFKCKKQMFKKHLQPSIFGNDQ